MSSTFHRLRSDQALDGSRPDVMSVAQLTSRIKENLETQFASVWVSGEVSDLARPQSGHIYLTLKDDRSQLRSVIWRTTVAGLPFDLEDGLEVACEGEISLYPPRGTYQLIIRHVEPLGIGALQLALQKLQAKLHAEGLFEARHKKSLPLIPRRIALITSPTGAVLRDFLEVLRRRWRGANVLVVPVRVQGKDAAAEIASAIERTNEFPLRPDVLVVGRGGGSLEDLWCFNDERVVRSIFASQIPVVSAVGHEIDVTLSDLVADRRALTPSEAAEIVVPDIDEFSQNLRQIAVRLRALLENRATETRLRLNALRSRRVFTHPAERIYDLTRRVDELYRRTQQAVRTTCRHQHDRVALAAGRMEALSPIAILARGYSVTVSANDQRIVRSADELVAGDLLLTTLGQGRIASRVESVDNIG